MSSTAPVPFSGAAAGQVALDDRASGAVEAVRAQPPLADTAHPNAVDPSTGSPIASATAHAVADAAAVHTNGSNGHHHDTAPAVVAEEVGPKLVYHSDPAEPASPPEKVKGLVRQTSSNGGGGYTSSAYLSQTTTSLPTSAGELPEVKAGFLSRIFFWWLNPLVSRGGKQALEDADMYDVSDEQAAAGAAKDFDVQWQIELARREADPSYKPSVNKALYRIFKFDFWLGACLKAVMDGLQFLQPILLEWLLTFIADSQFGPSMGRARPPDWHGYLLAAAIGLNPFFTTIMSNTYFRVMMKMGLRVRTILITQLYRKSLRLAPSAKQSMSVGTIVNMMSTDASKVDLFLGYIHYMWSAIEQVIIAIALLFRAIGPSAAAGIGVVLILIPIQGMVMKQLQVNSTTTHRAVTHSGATCTVCWAARSLCLERFLKTWRVLRTCVGSSYRHCQVHGSSRQTDERSPAGHSRHQGSTNINTRSLCPKLCQGTRMRRYWGWRELIEPVCFVCFVRHRCRCTLGKAVSFKSCTIFARKN
jgi:hypothetical protein